MQEAACLNPNIIYNVIYILTTLPPSCKVVAFTLLAARPLWRVPMRFPGPVRFVCSVALFTLLIYLSLPALAADNPAPPKVRIDWVDGPVTARLGDVAEIKVPASYRFTGKEGTHKFLELTQNPPGGNELGTIIPASSKDADAENSGFWFVIFEFSDVGYVKDDDRDKLDADALLKSLKDSTEESNKERARRGWSAYHVTSWYKAPFYEVTTKNLTWAMQGYAVVDNKQEPSVNYSVRILGRRGTMNADLVLAPNLVDKVVPNFEHLLIGFSFLSGNTYAEFRAGDKIAKYGLATLVAGGATAIALKTGLLAKFWKLIVVAFVSLLGFLKRAWNYFKRAVAGKASEETHEKG